MKKKSLSSGPSRDEWRAGIRCWVERGGKVVMGVGRADLLERIDATRSIRAAARELGMSYRRAWQLVQSINDGAGEAIVETATGGKQGGGAIVTSKGHELVARFRKLNRELCELAASFMAEEYIEQITPAKTDRTPLPNKKSSPRRRTS